MRTLLVLALVSASHPALAEERREGAFGLWKGMTLAEVKSVSKAIQLLPAGGPHYYFTRSPPEPIFPFSGYALAIAPKAGLCGVTAHTRHLPEGSKAAKDEAGVVLQMYMNRYGSPTHSGEDSSSRTVKWKDAQGPNSSITFTMHHADDGTSYLEVSYAFSNVDACRAEILKGI